MISPNVGAPTYFRERKWYNMRHHERCKRSSLLDSGGKCTGRRLHGLEGREHTIKAGENFAFAKNGAHWVRAEKPFKMALLLTLD